MSGTIDPKGVNTKGAGLRTAGPGPVTNQPVLAYNALDLDDLTRDQLKAIKVAELQFARDVSTRAAQAYQQLLDIIPTALDIDRRPIAGSD
jgi:hypothetical protein